MPYDIHFITSLSLCVSLLIKFSLLSDPEDSYTLTGEVRSLGLTMCRGTTVMLIMPVDGTEELLENPFMAAAEPVMD